MRRRGDRSKPHRSETVTTLQRVDMVSLQPNQQPHVQQQPMHAQAGAVSTNGTSPLTTQPMTQYSPATTVTHYQAPSNQPPLSLPGPSRKTSYPSPGYGSFIVYPLALCPPQVSTCYGCSTPLKPGGQITPRRFGNRLQHDEVIYTE